MIYFTNMLLRGFYAVYFHYGGNQTFAYMHKVMAGYNSRSINLVFSSDNCIDCLGKDLIEESESHRVLDVCHLEGFHSVILSVLST